jgi:PST family polysaccharide transporter
LKSFIYEHKTVFKNILALSLIQATNFILPLLTVPYIIITVGWLNFGAITFAQSFFSYLLYLTEYGFNITATREISINKDNPNLISNIVNEVLLIKTILLIVSFIITVICILMINKFSVESEIYYWGFLLVLGQAYVPIWFYQGIEKMQYLTYANVIGKIFFTIMIFIFIRTPKDYIYILPLYAMGNLASGFFCTYLMFKYFKIKWEIPLPAKLFIRLKNNWYAFISNFSINSYMNANLIILGFLTNAVFVGYYSVADRLINALKQILVVFFQATYPSVCRISQVNQQSLIRFFKKLTYPFCIAVFIGSLFLFSFSKQITFLLTKENISQVSELIKILSVTLPIIALNIPAYQTLLSYNYQKSYAKIFIIGSALNICLNFGLVPFFQFYGTAYSVIITELFITLGLYYILRVKHFNNKII